MLPDTWSKYLLTYLLTYSMVQSPSWEANWFAAGQEIPLILWNPKVHYRTHKRPPPVPVLDQPNPVHIPTSHTIASYSFYLYAIDAAFFAVGIVVK